MGNNGNGQVADLLGNLAAIDDLSARLQRLKALATDLDLAAVADKAAEVQKAISSIQENQPDLGRLAEVTGKVLRNLQSIAQLIEREDVADVLQQLSKKVG